MIEKIYADYKKRENENVERYFKSLGIIDTIEKTTPKKNIDLSIILEKSGLFKSNTDLKTKIGDEINAYTEEVFKHGMKIGFEDGQKNLLKEINKTEYLYEYLIKLNAKKFLKNHIKLTFNTYNLEFKNDNKNLEKTKKNYQKRFFEKLGFDDETVGESMNKMLKLDPKSKDVVLMSALYKNDKGMFKVSDLVDKHYFNSLFQGKEVGIIYGEKMIIDDIQSQKLTKQDIFK